MSHVTLTTPTWGTVRPTHRKANTSYTKFEVSSFSRSGDIIGGVKNFKMGHVTLTTPLSGGGDFFIGRSGLAMANLHNKFEVSICTRYEGTKSGAKSRN